MPRPHFKNRLKALATRYNPAVIYDIGANNPFDRHSGAVGLWQKIFPKAEFYLIEAAESHRSNLEKSGMRFEICALGSKEKQRATFYSHKKDSLTTGASLYLENSDYYNSKTTKKTKVVVKTLDRLISERDWARPDLIKIDTQGSELDILRGATSALRSAQIVICEVKLQEYNKKAPFAFEIESFLWEHDFRLIDVMATSYLNGWAIESDFLFVKKRHPLAKISSFSWKEQRKLAKKRAK